MLVQQLWIVDVLNHKGNFVFGRQIVYENINCFAEIFLMGFIDGITFELKFVEYVTEGL